MGAELGNFPHQRLQGRPEFKLRVGYYRVLYELDVKQGRIYLHYVGHRRGSTRGTDFFATTRSGLKFRN